MTDINAIRAEFEAARAAIDAMPNEGSILFNPATGLAISIPEGEEGHIAGIQFARIFTAEETHHGGNPPLGLDRQYSDGAGRIFSLYAIGVARSIAADKVDEAISALDMIAA